MLKTVIAIEADLASRIAIRYLCQLGRHVDLSINAVHALKTGGQSASPGTGWIRKTWEGAVLEQEKDQVTWLVRAEQASCRMLGNPLFLTNGKGRDEQIAAEVKAGNCDLFVEGALHRFEPDMFFERIGSKLYSDLSCPVLMVKNLVGLSKGVLFVTEYELPEKAVQEYLKIFQAPNTDPEVLVCGFNGASFPSEQKSESSMVGYAAKSLLESEGKSIKKESFVKGSPSALSAYVRDYSLIVSSVPRAGSPMAELLSKSPCSILFY